MQVPVTALYAGILALFALGLGALAGISRGKAGVSILYGSPVDMELAQRVRVHQNFLEYVPILLILMGLIELNGGSSTFLHVTGVTLVVARIAHAVGLKHDRMNTGGRAIGTGGTMLLTVIAALYAVWMSFGPLLG